MSITIIYPVADRVSLGPEAKYVIGLFLLFISKQIIDIDLKGKCVGPACMKGVKFNRQDIA